MQISVIHNFTFKSNFEENTHCNMLGRHKIKQKDSMRESKMSSSFQSEHNQRENTDVLKNPWKTFTFPWSSYVMTSLVINYLSIGNQGFWYWVNSHSSTGPCSQLYTVFWGSKNEKLILTVIQAKPFAETPLLPKPTRSVSYQIFRISGVGGPETSINPNFLPEIFSWFLLQISGIFIVLNLIKS